MSNKISEIQKQIDTLNHMLLGLQAQLDNEKQKEKKKEKLFFEFDETTSMVCISDKVRDFSTKGAEFEIRTLGEYKDNGFYLGEDDGGECPWEIVRDNHYAWVLKLKEIE